MKPKVTDWYPPEIKPLSDSEHTGWYECSTCHSSHWWDGQVWRYGPWGHRFWYTVEWRGLAEKPE